MASSPNIMILGLAKTGSTGLYTNVKAALAASSHDYYCLFEPTRADQLHNLHRYAPELPVLTKVMIAREPDLQLRYDLFDKRVTLLRDPRDMIVSFLLFRPFIRADIPWAQVEPFVEAIRDKERDPGSRSVHSLHLLADELGLASYRLERVVEFMEWQEALIDRHDVFVVRYADFIAGRLDELSHYLGVTVPTGVDGSPWLDHILRSAGTGDWRHWFTDEDVTFYRPHATRYMKRFDYDDDWQLADSPVIETATASAYIEGKYRRRRAQQEERRNGLTMDTAADAHRARLHHLAEDGNSQAMYRLAKAADGGGDDPAGTFRLAHRAAAQGHKPAMRLLSELYRTGRGVEADAQRAEFWAAEGAGQRHERGGLRRLFGRR
ncbi:MAG: hypothetical protein KY460_10375 [Actinobacteria bacterium]|nr:hypothetical protein [Actinomycetota bacterium]